MSDDGSARDGSVVDSDVTDSLSRADHAAESIRLMVIAGTLVPGQRLSEASVSESLGVSRNTLREAFRVLILEGLLVRRINAGVTVVVPSFSSIIDIYRVRRMIEVQTISTAQPQHPAARLMRAAVDAASRHSSANEWMAVGSDNMEFHSAIVALADSPHLDRLYRTLSAELRLAFGMLDDPEYLHRPYVELNARVLGLFASGDGAGAGRALEDYLVTSERTVLAAYGRRLAG